MAATGGEVYVMPRAKKVEDSEMIFCGANKRIRMMTTSWY